MEKRHKTAALKDKRPKREKINTNSNVKFKYIMSDELGVAAK